MKPEIAAKWTAALRSGKFSQGYDRLGDAEHGFCCLGVLAELARREGIIPQFYSGMVHLPPEVQAWAGMNNQAGYAAGLPHGGFLTNINDSCDYTFSQIADMIDEHVEEL